jgi:hypothetical protein
MPLPLPVEIVEYILQLVVAFPDLMSPCSLQYSMCSRAFLDLEDVKHSTRSLFSLALVCQHWNMVCNPVLYQCLLIDDSTDTDLLLRTLEHPQATTDPLGRIQPLGSLTRHLIIALSDQPAHENPCERLDVTVVRRFGNLGRLARRLPHLQTLSISIVIQKSMLWDFPMPYYGKDFAASVTRTCAQSLQKLHLHNNTNVLFTRQELHKLLESAPNLVAIVGRGCSDHITCPVALPYLPKLKYLTAHKTVGECDGGIHQDNHAPSLDHVHIRPTRYSNFWSHLLEAQGSTLTFLSLDLCVGNRADFDDCAKLPDLGRLCPGLSCLEVLISNWSLLPADLLPPIEYLGIRTTRGSSGIGEVASACKMLATIQLHSLRVIRLKDPDVNEGFALLSLVEVESIWSPLVNCPFRIVDCDGRELGPYVR